MRIIALAITLSLVLASTAGNAFASDKVLPLKQEKTLFSILLEKVASLLNTSAQASSSSSEMSSDKTSVLEKLNKYEVMVRLSTSGADLYLQKEVLLEKISKAKQLLTDSKFDKETKQKFMVQLFILEKEFNKDLVERPQESLKPTLLEFIDESEEIVFKMTDFEISELQRLLIELTI